MMSFKVYLPKEQIKKYGLELAIDDSLVPDIQNEKDSDMDDIDSVKELFESKEK